jgi:hypothetical protein
VSPDASALFPAGAVWSGQFRFRPPLERIDGDVVLTVLESRGESFRARYETERARFSWIVRGDCRRGEIAWDFTSAIKDNDAHSVVGRAHVYGRARDGVLSLVFRDDDSVADLSLTRVR